MFPKILGCSKTIGNAKGGMGVLFITKSVLYCSKQTEFIFQWTRIRWTRIGNEQQGYGCSIIYTQWWKRILLKVFRILSWILNLKSIQNSIQNSHFKKYSVKVFWILFK